MKITHVAEIVNITNVAGILEAEICGAENVRAILMYNRRIETNLGWMMGLGGSEL